ncbi:ABC-2 type transporter domain-containing protein [Ditylenchus destructor]|nr:ABC-2 type transporter domain-containing protein [Ditylenchus destructor]
MELSWHNITALPKNSKKRAPPLNGSISDSDEYSFDTCTPEDCILYDISGIAYPGEVLAVMGASGAGKTSLLNILTDRGAKAYDISGTIRINGCDVEPDVLRKISAYAQQKDVMIGAMTVKEHLMFMAKLRMGEEFSDEEKEDRVQNLMVELGLSHIADTMIGWQHRLKGISGGERKRLALASEILSNPLLLFCDEPTSGLDAYFTQQVIQVLKDLARKENMAVVITIHQPSAEVFEMFDKLCLLAVGQVVYLGPPNGVYEVFKNAGYEIEEFTNAAETIIHIVALNDGDTMEAHKNRLQQLRIAYTASTFATEYRHRLDDSITEKRKDIGIESALERPRYAASWCTQLYELSKRSIRNSLRDPMLLRVRLAHVVITSIIIGAVYWQVPLKSSTVLTYRGILFNAARDMNFMFLMPSVAVFTDELPTFLRESHANIYRTDTYFIAKNIAELPQYVILPWIYTTIVFWMTGIMPNFVQYLIFALVCIAMANTSLSVGYAAACIFGSIVVAIQILPLISIPMMVFGGFFINLETIPWYFMPVSYLSWYRYTIEANMINMWHPIQCIPGCPKVLDGIPISSECDLGGDGLTILLKSYFSTTTPFVFLNVGILIAMCGIYRLIGMFALYMRARFTP